MSHARRWRRCIKSMKGRFGMAASTALLAAVLIPVSGVYAQDPGTAASTAATGTGIRFDPNEPTSPESLGYTAAYAAQKTYEASLRMTPRGVLAARSGGNLVPGLAPAASASRALAASPNAALAPTSATLLAWWRSYHQKTKYNCLPAIGQSILGSNFPSAGYASPSVAAKQGDASHAPGTIAAGMGTTTDGTSNSAALKWVNAQFAARGSSIRYIASDITNETTFKAKIVDQIFNLDNALYERVDLTSGNYAWNQSTPAWHATAVIGYSNSGALVTIDDPFTHLSGSTCVASPYTSANDISCNWVGFPTHRYFLAKDRVASHGAPLWW